VVDVRDGRDFRTARVVFDGVEGWWIDDGEKVELRVDEGRATFVQPSGIERVDHENVYANGWVKAAVEGRLMAYMDEAAGDVKSSEMIDGRRCWMAEVSGLKAGVEEAIKLFVDQETGVILLSKGNGAELQVRDLHLGTIESKS
jgi:hypothetical protein